MTTTQYNALVQMIAGLGVQVETVRKEMVEMEARLRKEMAEMEVRLRREMAKLDARLKKELQADIASTERRLRKEILSMGHAILDAIDVPFAQLNTTVTVHHETRIRKLETYLPNRATAA